MSRLRATLSTSPVDKEIAQRVAEAERSLRSALQVCERATVSSSEARRRHAATKRDLQQALGALAGVRRVQPSYDTSDPDLTETVVKPRVRPAPAPSVDTGSGE